MKTRHTLYIIVLLLLLFSEEGLAQTTSLDYKCEFHDLSGWVASTQSNGIWHIGTGQDGAKYSNGTNTYVCNQLNQSDSYLYIDNDDIADKVTNSENGLKKAYISQVFNFESVDMPILSFDYYFYFNNTEFPVQAPIIRIEADISGSGLNYKPIFPTGEILTTKDEWQHANVCLSTLKGHSRVDIRVCVFSVSAGHFKVSFDNFEIQNFSKTAINLTPSSCFGYDDGAIEIEVKGGGPNYDYSCDNGVTWVNVADKKYKFTGKTNSSYNLQVRDVITGCVIGPISQTLEAAVGEIKFSATPSDILCFGQTDGYIELHGKSNLQYSLNGDEYKTTTKFQNLSGGDYTIRAREGGCESAPETVTIGADVFMEIEDVIPTHITRCYGDKTGSIYVNASVSSGQIDYSFDGGHEWNNHRDTKEQLAAGKYKITIKDANNCTLDWPEEIEITQPDELVYSGEEQNPVTHCYGDENGSIIIHTPTGGTPDYEYSNNGGDNFFFNNEFKNLKGDYIYSLVVRDSKGCLAKGPDVTLSQPEKVVITDTKLTDVNTCYGDQTGSIEIVTTGGTGQMYYSLSQDRNDWQTSPIFAVGAGEYYPMVKDANDCPDQASAVNITQPNKLEIIYISPINNTIKCNGYTTGQFLVQAHGGTLPYDYSYTNNSITDIISMDNDEVCTFRSVPAGVYDVTVTDRFNCHADAVSVAITQPDPLKMTIKSSSNASCYNFPDASVELIAEGGTPTYSYQYRRNGIGDFSSSPNNVLTFQAGDFEFKIKDDNGCETPVQTLTLTEPADLVANIEIHDITKCYTDKDGSIEVKVTGGTEPYKYSINNEPFQSSNVFNNLAPGYYNIIVDDQNGCGQDYVYRDQLVNAPEQMVIRQFYSEDVKGCKGESLGKIAFEIEGGSGTITFSKDGGKTFVPETYPDGIEFFNLPAGKYTPVAKDEHNCLVTHSEVVIKEPETLEIQKIETSPAYCYGDYNGSATITVVGGKQLQEEFPYTFYLNGSTVADNYTGKFLNLPAGDYTFIAEDEYGCPIDGAFSIGQPEEIKVVQKDSTNITTCYGDRTGTITFKVAGGIEPFTYIAKGYNYYDENTTGHFTDLPASGYELIATDAHKCSVDTIVTIEQPTKFAYHAKITNEIMCHGDDDAAISVSASGGTAPYYFSFDNGKTYPYTESSYSNVNPGRYYVKAKDAKGCTHDYVYNLEIIDPPQLEADYEKYDVICNTGNTGKILASAKGGTKPYQFSIDEKVWRYNSGVFSNLTDSTYSVTVKDGHNCTVKLTDITLTRPPNIAGFTVNESEGCSPLLVTMTQDNTGGLATYDISDGTKIYDCTGPTSYTFVNRTGHAQTFVIKATMMQAGGVGCTDTASLQVKVLPQPDSDVRVTNSSAIFPETTINFANMTQNITEAKWDFDDDTYSDNINEQSHTYKSCGKYNITLIQSNGMCYDTLSIPFVIEGRPVIAAMKANNIQGCQPVTVEFTNSSSNCDSCVWNFGDGTTSTSPMLKHTFEGAGDYEVTLTAYGDCGAASTTSKTIHVYAQPSADFTQNADTLYEGQALHLTSVSEGGAYYAWDFGDGKKSDEKHPVHNYEFGGTFTISLIVTSPNSCTDTAFVKNAVTVIKSPIVVFPNAFTPDGDGLNDIFLPVHGDISQFKIFIFDKKGQLMYKGTDITEGWDGTRNGHPCPTGVYVYKANIVLRDKSFYDLKGYVVLLRLPAKK